MHKVNGGGTHSGQKIQTCFLSGGLNYVNNFENKYQDVFLSGLIGCGFPH